MTTSSKNSAAGFDKYQKIVLASYGEHCVETPADVDVCGDGLLQFLLAEFSEQEDCESIEQALRRIKVAQAQLLNVHVGLMVAHISESKKEASV